MATKRKPKTLKLTETAEQRDKVELWMRGPAVPSVGSECPDHDLVWAVHPYSGLPAHRDPEDEWCYYSPEPVEVQFEIKLPSELSVSDFEEIHRIMESWDLIDSKSPEEISDEGLLPQVARLIRRMIDVFFYDRVPREVVDTLDSNHMRSLASFLEERLQVNAPRAMRERMTPGRR